VEEIVRKCVQACDNPYGRLADWKAANGRPIVGCFPMYVPEELVHAAGALPVTILGSEEPIMAANDLLQNYVCAVVRSSFDLALNGALDFLDGMIFPDVCDTVQCLADLWDVHRPKPFHHSFAMPGKVNAASSRQYLLAELYSLKAGLEKLTGRRIDDDTLLASIAVFNEHRAKMRRLYALRRANPGLLSASEMVSVVVSSMLMPKEEHNRLLDGLLVAAERRTAPAKDRVRLLLAGNLCDEPEPSEMLDMIEELGAVVVDDDLFTGRKYFANDVRSSGDPMEALAEHFLDFAPCPTRHDPAKDWPRYIIDLARASEAQGVVLLTLKYCEVLAFDLPYVVSRLDEAGIPHFLIETDHEMASLGQVRTRLQAFVEMLGGA
jgi:benzoyl-CoA reductase subunit C